MTRLSGQSDGGGPALISPCINVCKMEGDLCAGCYRTLDEIARWMVAGDDDKRQILAAVARRKALARPAP